MTTSATPARLRPRLALRTAYRSSDSILPGRAVVIPSWDINGVRIPLNEGCWNGESYVNPAYAGGSYRDAIKAYVDLLTANGIYVILDLHWSDGMDLSSSGCGSAEALCEKPMPDAAQAVPFWKYAWIILPRACVGRRSSDSIWPNGPW